jgi:DNA repair photolyase
MTPLLPWITADDNNVRSVVNACAKVGVRYITAYFGTTMRDGSREHFYTRLDELYPGLRHRYEARYGNAYICDAPNAAGLRSLFESLCDSAGIAWREADVASFFRVREQSAQISLF